MDLGKDPSGKGPNFARGHAAFWGRTVNRGWTEVGGGASAQHDGLAQTSLARRSFSQVGG